MLKSAHLLFRSFYLQICNILLDFTEYFRLDLMLLVRVCMSSYHISINTLRKLSKSLLFCVYKLLCLLQTCRFIFNTIFISFLFGKILFLRYLRHIHSFWYQKWHKHDIYHIQELINIKRKTVSLFLLSLDVFFACMRLWYLSYTF